jgi:hypothetical protein
MERAAVFAAVDEFLALIEVGRDSPEENISALRIILDRLAIAGQLAEEAFDETAADPPSGIGDYQRYRALAGQRFPSFGYYNLPIAVTEQLMATELMLGDALDDLADIGRDLADVRWSRTHTSEADALWRVRWGFEVHWGHHLRTLQWYLHAYQQERS